MNRIFFLLCALFLSLSMMSQSIVHNLDITVTLKHNGDAHIREVWKIDIGEDVKTEWYVVHYHIGERKITNLTVSDNGSRLTTLKDEWDVDASKAEKAGKCGLRSKKGGYELCWGVPTLGRHVYTVDYDLEGLVLSFPDKDGFGYWFADLNDVDPIKAFSVSVKAPFALSHDNCQVWGFGYKGTAKVTNGTTEALSTGEIDKIGLLMSFRKGLFAPSLKGKGSFAELQAEAFKGSDFGGGSEEGPMSLFEKISWIVGGVVIAVLILIAFIHDYRLKRNAKMLPYYKEVSPAWTLLTAAKVLEDYGWYKQKNLFAALMLRLISKGKLSVEVGEKLDKKGRKEKVMKVVPTMVDKPFVPARSDDYLCDYLLYILAQAKDQDGIIQQDKLEQWAENNTEDIEDFYHAMDTTTVEDTMSDSERQHLLGLRNYLADFNKTGDRSITEVRVWDDIIIYSQLFGFTKKLMKELHQVCPDYANLSAFGQEVDDISIYFLIYACSDSVNGVISSYTSEAVEASLNGGGDFGGGGGGGGR